MSLSSTISNPSLNPILILGNGDGPVSNPPFMNPLTPFIPLTVNDPNPAGTPETLTITLANATAPGVIGSITDPTGGGTFNPTTGTFTETTTVDGASSLNEILARLVYTPPASVTDGDSTAISAAINITDGSGATAATTGVADNLKIVTAPLITETVATQPDGGGPIDPFSTVAVTDADFAGSTTDTATITITDGGGPTDAYGLLTGSGLSKSPTAAGTYTIPNPVSPAQLVAYLKGLTFTPSVAADGQTISFSLKVMDAQTGLTETNTGTSISDTAPPNRPVIAGTGAGQTVASGSTIDPFANVTITDPNSTPTDTATISLVTAAGISDADGTVAGTGLTETGPGSGVYTLAATDSATLTKEIDSLVFTPIALPSGHSQVTTTFDLAVNDTNDGQAAVPNNVTTVIETAPAPPPPLPLPTITGTVADQMVASGSTIAPFAKTTIADPNTAATDTATISLVTAAGISDLDGTLSGAGLTETSSPGVYTLASANPTTLAQELDKLVFTPIALASGYNPVTTTFDLAVNDTNDGQTATDNTTTVTESPAPPPAPPSITGTVAGQMVASGSTVAPFAKTTIADPNPTAADTITISLDTATGISDADGTLSGAGLTETGPGSGVYTLASANDLAGLMFTPTALAAGHSPVTTMFDLKVNDTNDGQTATDHMTTVIETAPMVSPTPTPTLKPTPSPTPTPTPTPVPTPSWLPPLGSDNFSVSDQSGQFAGDKWQVQGTPYSGPVAGLTSEFIAITPDNINITAETPNSFIGLDGGTGEDAIDVSHANGNNVLNGSTGSSFLYGGSGDDTFFVDDRNPPAGSSIWSTVVGFHSGDNATVWGVTPNDFDLSWVDGQGAAGYTGLTLHATGPGKPTASLTLTGLTSADMSNGHLAISFGITPNLPNLPGSDYMLIHYN